MSGQLSPDSKVEDYRPLNIEEACVLIRDKFNLIVDKNDPLMLCVLLEQAFHADRENQFKTHMAKLSKVIETNASISVDAVNESLSLLKDEALKGSLENTLAAVTEKARGDESLYQSIKSFRRVSTVLTLLNWAAVIALFFIFK